MSHCDCDECSADFERRADQIHAALEDTDPVTELELLSMFAGRFLAEFNPETREQVRLDMLREIDGSTKGFVTAGCDA